MTVYLTTDIDKYEVNQLSNYTKYVDVKNLFYKFNRLGETYILSKDRDFLVFTDNDAVIVRSSNNFTSLFGKVVHKLYGVKLNRPVKTLTTRGVPKINSEIDKHKNHPNKINWWFVTSWYMLENHYNLLDFPVVYKPPSGSHGRGIVLLETPQQLCDHVYNNHDWSVPVFLQEFIDKKFEYRVIVYNGEVISAARKMLKTRSGNQFGGRRFAVGRFPSRYSEYIREVSKEGLVGIDIVWERGTDMLYIVEENRAPEFEAVDRATGLDTARLIVERLSDERSNN